MDSSFISSPEARAALGLTHSRCTAKARSTGERCNRPAISGGFVCGVHGGQLPHVKDAAKNRLMEIAEPAAYSLRMVVVDLTAEWERAAALSDDPARVAHFMSLAPSIVRAAQIVLDRCGLSPAVKLEVSAPNPFEGMSASELADAAEAFAREARAAANEEAQLLLGDGSIVDAEVIK